MFPSQSLQSDAVKCKHVLDKQLFMHCVKKKSLVFSTAPKYISDSNKHRRYDFQAFVNTSGNIKFPENLQPSLLCTVTY